MRLKFGAKIDAHFSWPSDKLNDNIPVMRTESFVIDHKIHVPQEQGF